MTMGLCVLNALVTQQLPNQKIRSIAKPLGKLFIVSEFAQCSI